VGRILLGVLIAHKELALTSAVALLSGGLDSQLAVRLVQQQGIEVLGLYFSSVFNAAPKDGGPPSAVKAASALTLKLETVDISTGQIELLKDPPHGLGSAANPCIDCHMLMLKIAAGRMRETGAAFLVTGEVLGQRPMSQRRHALDLIDRETGLEGLILRPLSARHLAETTAENEGLIDRLRLEAIRGRSRTRQMALAEKFGLSDYPSPAGGCLLTDPGFAHRIFDLLDHNTLDLDNARLLKAGRHYRLGPRTKAVTGRNEAENYEIESLAIEGDLFLFLDDAPGPTTLLRGEKTDDYIETAARLTARASRARSADLAVVRVSEAPGPGAGGHTIEVTPASDELAALFSINR